MALLSDVITVRHSSGLKWKNIRKKHLMKLCKAQEALKVSEGLSPDVPLWDPSSLQRLMKNDDLSILKLCSAHIFALDYESREMR